MSRRRKGAPADPANSASRSDDAPSVAEIERVLDLAIAEFVTLTQGKRILPGWASLLEVGAVRREFGTGEVWVMPEAAARRLVAIAETSPDAFDAASSVAAGYIAAGFDMPLPLRVFAAQALNGERKRPVSKGRRRRDDALKILWQYSLARLVHERGEVPLARNRESQNDFNACQLVADAFTRADMRTTYQDMETLCFSTKGQPPDIRAVAEALGFLDFSELDALWHPRPRPGK